MRCYNGQYKTVDSKMTEAHYEALELLGVIHQICKDNNLRYTLVGEALVRYLNKQSISAGSPNISIVLKYEDFCILKDRIKSYVGETSDYVFADINNVRQFDSLSFWFAKRNKVLLPEGREQDEIYYYTHINVTPAFFVCDKNVKTSKAYRMAKRYTNIVNARDIVPELPLSKRMRNWKKYSKHKSYRKKRTENMYKQLESELSKLNGNYRMGFLPNEQIMERKELEEVKEASFEGCVCYISCWAMQIIDRYSEKFKEKILNCRSNDLVRNSGETLRRLQLIQLEMLIELDRICRKYKIRYNIAFGTLLGAVRHKGFIPWDDDIDVILPIEDYIRLDKLMNEELDETRFFWKTANTEEDNNLTFGQLRRNGTICVRPEREQYNIHRGVFIDVFPVFHQANNRVYHWIQTKMCRHYRKATWAHMGAESVSGKIAKMYYTSLKKQGNKKNYQSFMKWAMSSPAKNKYYSYFNAPVRYLYHTYFLSEDAFNDTVELEFEGCYFKAPKDYQAVLVYLHGNDYKLYPSDLSHRTPDHLMQIDLKEVCPLDVKRGDVG